MEPASTAHARKKQIRWALKLRHNRLRIRLPSAGKSYVHPSILTAFETGTLKAFAGHLSWHVQAHEKKEPLQNSIVAAAAA